MKHVRLILICIITILVGVQSVDVYTENALKETEIEKTVSDEYVVSFSFKEINKPEQVAVVYHVTPCTIVVNRIGEDFNPSYLFLMHRSLLI